MVDALVEQVQRSAVAFTQMQGPYSQMPQAFGTLYGWVGSHGLTPMGMPRGVYYTDPATTPEAEARWEVQTPLADDPEDMPADTSCCGVKHIEAHTEVWALHKGPYESIAPTYEALGAWIAEHGYVITGAPLEVYLSDPANTAPSEYLTEVRFPVQML